MCSGADHVHADALLGVLHRGGLGQAVQAVLGRAVRRRHRRRRQAVDRRHVDDRTATGRDHRGQFVLHREPHALQIGGERVVPFVLGNFGDRHRPQVVRQRRRVDRPVEPAPALHDRVDQRGDLIGPGHVRLHVPRARAERGDRALALAAIAAGDRHVRATLHEQLRRGKADARRSTDHHGDLLAPSLHVSITGHCGPQNSRHHERLVQCLRSAYRRPGGLVNDFRGHAGWPARRAPCRKSRRAMAHSDARGVRSWARDGSPGLPGPCAASS